LKLTIESLGAGFMKSMVFRQIWAFFAVVVLAGCATSIEVVSDRDDVQPPWAGSPHNFYEWKRGQVDSNEYFLGISKRGFKELQKANLEVWSAQQAFDEASNGAKRELGQKIVNEITIQDKDYFKVKNGIANEEFSSVINTFCSVIIQNASPYDQYTETHKQITKKGKNITTIT
jgi:putative salt-induced outer membrane protein YdiY